MSLNIKLLTQADYKEKREVKKQTFCVTFRYLLQGQSIKLLSLCRFIKVKFKYYSRSL
jgi:hypothetical protein